MRTQSSSPLSWHCDTALRALADRSINAEDHSLAIDYQKRDGVAYITLNNPAKANILDKKISDEITAAWTDLWEDREIRCAILTGAGDKHFCGGHNLAPRPDITQKERERLGRKWGRGHILERNEMAGLAVTGGARK